MTTDGEVAEQLREELKILLVERLRLRDVSPASITDDEPLVRGPLGLDSIDILELALAVEDRYGVRITDEQIGQQAFQTIAALAAFIQDARRRPAGPGSAAT
jgi:acyl carrier protein